jgi:hypothetical protein
MLRCPLIILAIGAAVGCSSTPPARAPSPVQALSLNTARVDLFPGPADAAPLAEELGLASGNLADTALARLLHTRLALPRQVSVAVLHLPAAGIDYGWWRYPSLTAQLTAALADSVSAAIARTPRVARAAVLPTFIIGTQRAFTALQEAAARFQADVLLLYRPTCRVYEDAPVFGRITYQSTCTLEAVLLDTRTGLIPWAAVATRDDVTRRQRRDRDTDATVMRAQFAATLAALGEIAGRVGVFLTDVPQSSP